MAAPAPSKVRLPKDSAAPANSSLADSADPPKVERTPLGPANATADDRHKHHHTAYAAEASGLLVIALLLLILVLIRYWPYIAWSAR